MTAEIHRIHPHIYLTTERIDRLGWEYLREGNYIESTYYDGMFSMPLTTSTGIPSVQLGEGVGKTPEEAIARTLLTARRAYLEGGHPADYPEAETGRLPQSLRRASRFGMIAMRSDLLLERLNETTIGIRAEIPVVDRKPYVVTGRGPGIVAAISYFVQEFDFGLPPFNDIGKKRLDSLPPTSFDSLE